MTKKKAESYQISIGDRPVRGHAPHYGNDFFNYLFDRMEADPDGVMNDILQCLHRLWYSKPFQTNAWMDLVDIGNEVFQMASQDLQIAFTKIVCNKKRRGDLLQVCETRTNMFRVFANEKPEEARRKLKRERSTLPFRGIYIPRNGELAHRQYTPDQDERHVLQMYLLNISVEIVSLLHKKGQPWGLQIEANGAPACRISKAGANRTAKQ